MAVNPKCGVRLTLKAKKAIARQIIDRYQVGQPFNEVDLQRLADLTDTELRYAVRRKNPTFPSDPRHIHIIGYDWSEPREWSWNKAIVFAHARDPEEARATRERQQVMSALRLAVKADMEDFRVAYEPQECAAYWCRSTEDLTTDHVKPPFIAIARAFLELHPVIELRSVPGSGCAIACPDLEAEWIAFHAARAVYQLLCRSCNSSKGAR